MDSIEINGLRVYAHHGVLEHEQRDGQVFVIDLSLEADLSAAAGSDVLADTLDYGLVAERVASAATQTRFDLLEALAGHLATVVLKDPRVQAVTVRVCKPSAPIPLDFDDVAVVIRRGR
jgi:7,8-dihydroneopterin aldolase/epimerase/oxygenase